MRMLRGTRALGYNAFISSLFIVVVALHVSIQILAQHGKEGYSSQ